jgi:DedD protein
MEKKKLLLVSVSTGIFLMLVVGASILVFSPRTVPTQTVVSPGNAVVTASLPDLAGAAGEKTVKPEEPAKNAVPVVSIIADPVETVAPVVKIEPAVAETPAAVQKLEPVEQPAAVQKPTVIQQPPVIQQPVVAQKPIPSPKPAVVQKPAVSQKAESVYWVQIGSYSVKSGADKAKANLSERGLTSVIFDSDVQGKTYYRVRVGPYVSQAEADYWLKLVKTIDGYEKSQVWKSGA